MGIAKVTLSSSIPSNNPILNKADVKKLQLDIISELIKKLRKELDWHYGNKEYTLHKMSEFKEGISDMTFYIKALETCNVKIPYYNRLIKLLEEEV